jgi:hypothetical protein
MRTTFFEMHLFNDTSFMNSQSFIWNGKEWCEGKREREKEKERERETEGGRERVAAWVINLTIGQVLNRAIE